MRRLDLGAPNTAVQRCIDRAFRLLAVAVRSPGRTGRLAACTVVESLTLCVSLTGLEPVGRGV